jgi:hypothetical protein
LAGDPVAELWAETCQMHGSASSDKTVVKIILTNAMNSTLGETKG